MELNAQSSEMALGFLATISPVGRAENAVVGGGKNFQRDNQFFSKKPTSPEAKPKDLQGKTADEIKKSADDKGLVPDPKNPNKFRDPVTGKERIRIDKGHVDPKTGKPYDNPNAAGDHAHGYGPDGKPVVNPETGDKHFPIKPPNQ